MKKKICFFGAASEDIEKNYVDKTEELGEYLGENFDLVFGGGATGLMGAIARGFAKEKSIITGVVPRFMEKFEDIYDNCTNVISVDSMHSRKKIMEEEADIFVIAPGGIGTLDEFFEVLTDTSLNLYNKPIILFNINSFYDDIIKFINNNLNTGFIHKDRIHNFYICNNIDEVKNILHLFIDI